MYNQPTLPLTAGGAALAGMNGIWWLLASFALLAAGTAVMRIIPRQTDLDAALLTGKEADSE